MKKQICALIAAGLMLAGCENEAPAPAPTYSGGGTGGSGEVEKTPPAPDQVAE